VEVASRFAVTLSSRAPLECRVVLFLPAWDRPVAELPAALARAADTVDHDDAHDGRHLGLRFTEPLEVLAGARRLADAFGCEVRGIAVPSVDALELLNDTNEPTRSAWTWVIEQLAIDVPGAPFVGARRAGTLAGVRPLTIALHYPTDDGPRRQVFDRDQIAIGRSSAIDLVIRSSTLARKHCGFVRSAHWSVQDYGSTNGTYLDGRPVDVGVRVETGDVIKLGYVETLTIEVIAIV
jgi:FHA domain-containing protein